MYFVICYFGPRFIPHFNDVMLYVVEDSRPLASNHCGVKGEIATSGTMCILPINKYSTYLAENYVRTKYSTKIELMIHTSALCNKYCTKWYEGDFNQDRKEAIVTTGLVYLSTWLVRSPIIT